MIDRDRPSPTLLRGPFRPPRRSRRGFSLIEILVVLVILAVLTTIALFSYANYRDAQSLQTSSDLVRRVLMQARNRAVHLNLPQQVVIDLDQDTIWIDQFNSSLTQIKPKVVPEHAVDDFVDIEEVRIGPDTFTTGIHAIPFETDGRHPLVIVILHQNNVGSTADESYYTVRLFPTSGEAQVLAKRRL